MPRYATLDGPNLPLSFHDAPTPSLEPGAALVRTVFSEVCGTDIHLLHGKLAGVPYPIIPGHVNVAEFLESRGEVRDVDGHVFGPGDRLTFFDVHATCGQCWYCSVGKATTRCPSRKVYGITYGAAEGLLGGWSEEIYLKPGVKLLRLPDALPSEEFIGGGCGLPTSFHAVERSGVRLADTVYVQGAGPVGLSAVVLAQLSGAARVIVSGAPALRLTMARELGADLTLDILATTAAERVEAVRAATGGRGADVVIEACGNPEALPEGLEAVRDGGVYTVVGHYTDHGAIPVNPHSHLNRKHVDVRGCWGYDFSHLYRSLKVMEKHHARFRWSRLVSRIYPLAQAGEALRAVENLEVVKAVIDPRL